MCHFLGRHSRAAGHARSLPKLFDICISVGIVDGAIASIFPVSGEICPVSPHVPVLKGGERAAMDEAIELLKELPANRGLKHHIDEY